MFSAALGASAAAATVSIDTSAAGRRQVIDGFGTCLSSSEGLQSWWQQLYFEELRCSILRMDLTPRFKSPYTGMNGTYNSPWYHNNPSLPGPENNNVRTYSNATDYQRSYNGWSAPIAVMGPDINQNLTRLNFSQGTIGVAGALAKIGLARQAQLGDFKLIGSLWSPAPWVKISSGNNCPNWGGVPMPVAGTPWPFIWYNNYAGGKLDTSGALRPEFDDSALGGSGPTSALTQFARCTAAYLRGFQNTYQVRFYAISIQNELNFEQFYDSCTYPLSAGYIAALKAVRAELDKYPDLAPIKLMGPEDLLGGDAYGMWQYGGGDSTIHKNLQYLQNLATDPQAMAALDFYCIHGYASDGASAANATPTLWNWWANGWSASPAPGIPSNVRGFTYYGRKSWMTETSGESPAWLAPTDAFPKDGAWSLALRIQQALTAGQQSAWVYWQMTDGSPTGDFTLTDSTALQNAPKLVAAKHFFRLIRPGAVRVEANVTGASNVSASAFLHEANGTLTIVLVNAGADPEQLTVQSPQLPVQLVSWQTFTSQEASYWQSAVTPVVANQATVTVPRYGVVTLHGAVPPLLQVSTAAPEHVTITWKEAPGHFVLQFAPELQPPGSWSTVTNSADFSNGTTTVTLPANSPASLFRLIQR